MELELLVQAAVLVATDRATDLGASKYAAVITGFLQK